MIIQTPTTFFLVTGAAQGFTMLNAFDTSLIEAGIGDVNLIRLSSILPPGCAKIERMKIQQGSLVPVAYASKMSDVPGAVISSAVAVAIPEDGSLAGLIMEYSSHDYKSFTEQKVIMMAERGMRNRHRKIKEIFSIASEIKTDEYAASFSGVVLWD